MMASRHSRLLLYTLVLGGTVYFVLQHMAVVNTVWPAIGTGPGAQRVLMLDGIAMVAWLMTLVAFFSVLRFRGDPLLLVLPFLLWCVTRPFAFGVLTDPLSSGTRPRARVAADSVSMVATPLFRPPAAIIANRFKLLQLNTRSGIDSADLAKARQRVADAAAIQARTMPPLTWRWVLSSLPLIAAPLIMAGMFLFARAGLLTAIRRGRVAAVVGGTVALLLARVLAIRGVLAGFTPIELGLPVAAIAVVAHLAERVADLRLGPADAVRAAAGVIVSVVVLSLPFFPLTHLGGPHVAEVGLLGVLLGAVVTAALAMVLRPRFLATVVAVSGLLVASAFTLSERPRERLANAFDPYPQLRTMSPEAQRATATRNAQVRSSDAAILGGGLLGRGAGRGLAALVPRAGDDTFFAAYAADTGLIGVLVVVGLYGLLLVRTGELALSLENAYARGTAAALGALLALPLCFAYFGALRLLPLTGVAAAFVSMGGAKLVAASAGQGILAYLSHQAAVSRLRSWTP